MMSNDTASTLVAILWICVIVELVLLSIIVRKDMKETQARRRARLHICPHGFSDSDDCPDCRH